jgi:hypothetical protein
VNSDGSFSPTRLFIHDGDTVEWRFNDRTDTIIPVDSTGSTPFCTSYKPYDPSDPNEFTGPLPRAASGIFTLGPDGAGFVIDSLSSPNPSCNPNNSAAWIGDQFLCDSGEPFASMDWTWQNPNITGVFIRLRWKTVHGGPGIFDWTVMDREIEKAVLNGKMYSLSFKAGSKGTPDWIFDPTIAGANVVNRLTLQDTGDNPDSTECGVIMNLGSPADPNYRLHYFELWKAAAQRIRARNAWYRALAYVKPSGANLFSHENRLPNRCETNCNICNPQVWAEQGDYTPTALYEFYSKQTALLAEEFPDKDMSYMLIQAGFPRVNDHGEWQVPQMAPLPGGTEQTETILGQGQVEHALRFVVQHNGLGVKPQDRPNPQAACPNEGVHPAVGPFARAGSGCPNRWVLEAGERGQVTGFQTNNAKGVANPIELESALQNAWDNSDAVFLEIYEQRLWQAETAGPILDPGASGRTIGEWAEMFHERRRDFWADQIPDPFPMTHRHTFRRTTGSESDDQLLYYMNSAKCDLGSSPQYGVIIIKPDNVTSVEEEAIAVPAKFELCQNYPNPFNPTTTITYSVQRAGRVELKIYNTLGRVIRTLVARHQAAGEYSLAWDGKDASDKSVASGNYFVTLKAGDFHSARKMILLQ